LRQCFVVTALYGGLASFLRPQEFQYVHFKRLRQSLQAIYGNVRNTPLKLGDISAVEVCLFGKNLLADATLGAKAL